MGDTERYLEALAAATRNGFGFLCAFGLTWCLAGVVWRRWGDRAGAYAALFQGVVALPLALTLTALFAAGPRPADPTMNSLSIYLASGQLLMLPLAIVLVRRAEYTSAAALLAVTTAVHFVPYSWLYRTPGYAAVGTAIAVGVAVLIGRGERATDRPGAAICLLTGAALLIGSALVLLGVGS